MLINTNIVELNENDKEYYRNPVDANIKLHKHQLILLQKCIEFETNCIKIDNNTNMNTNIGVIADNVGSGKSYVILSIIKECQNIESKKLQVQTFGNNKIAISKTKVSTPVKTSMLVIPHNIFFQWQKYIKDFGANLNTFFVSRTTNLNELREMDVETIKNLDLIVATCSFYSGIFYSFRQKNIKVQRLIFDEVDSLNASIYEEIENSFIWFVTASYNNLLYPYGMSGVDKTTGYVTHSAYGFKKPGFAKNIFINLSTAPQKYTCAIILKNNEEFVNQAFDLPQIKNHYIECKSPHYLNILNGLVESSVINCLNAIDIKAAIQQIPFKNRKSENNIIDMFISKYKVQIANLNSRINFIHQIETNTEESRNEELKKIKESIVDIETKIQSIKDRIKNSESCFICYEDISEKTILSCCSNSMCFKCIHTWILKTPKCPLCKSQINKESLYIVNENDNYENILDYSKMVHKNNDKFTNLLNILNTLKPESRVLLFSSYDNTLYKIVDLLDEMKIGYSFLKGNQNVISKTINSFKSGETQILLVNPLYYGSGLNLEMTTDIIMFHKFDSEIENQVIGRAQRYGRKESLNIWYLLHENELGYQKQST